MLQLSIKYIQYWNYNDTLMSVHTDHCALALLHLTCTTLQQNHTAACQIIIIILKCAVRGGKGFKDFVCAHVMVDYLMLGGSL